MNDAFRQHEARVERFSRPVQHRVPVLGLARHSETLEPLVVYQALYGERGLWVRPAAMFTQTILHAGVRVPRFAFISAE